MSTTPPPGPPTPAPPTAEQLAAARQARTAATEATKTEDAAHRAAQRQRGADTSATQAALDRAKAAQKAAEDTYAQLHNRDLENLLHPDDWALVVDQIERACRGDNASAFVTDIVRPCGRVANRNCAGVSPPASQRLPAQVFDELNAANGSQIDFAFLAQWEGGLATTGYVPWWPQRERMRIDRGAVVLDTRRDDAGRLLGAAGNSSGVTVGVGVDLGQQDPKVYQERLKNAGASEELIQKLMPYVGLKQAEACTYLRENPLTLTQEEAILISREAKQDIYKRAERQYYDATNDGAFNKLPPAEQTVLYSRTYQQGNITRRSGNLPLVDAAASGNRTEFLRLLQDRAVHAPNQCLSPDHRPTAFRNNGERLWKEFQYVARQPWPTPAPTPPPNPAPTRPTGP
ncbi:MAG: pesticin C-terminus-like muramidase [Aquimonas sp.]|nr:pesticin C-terminus-like muramidase [Aquimonas sp.]